MLFRTATPCVCIDAGRFFGRVCFFIIFYFFIF